MRILLITTTLAPESGWGTYSLNTAQGLLARGHMVLTLVHTASGAPCEQRPVLPSERSMLRSPFARWRATRAIREAIRAFQPVIIHVLVEPYALAMPMVHPPCQWVMNLHGTYSVLPYTRWHTRSAMCRATKKAAGFLACSRFTLARAAEAFEHSCGCSMEAMRKRAVLFRFGMEEHAQTKMAKKISQTKHILHVGEVKDRKGVLELIRGFSLYKNETGSPAHLDIVGRFMNGGQYIHNVERLIQELGLSKDVTVHGHIEEVQLKHFYENADALALLSKSDRSHFEGFGLVLLEANQWGIPVIGSRDSGCAEAIKEGSSGYTVDPSHPEEIAERLHWILDEKRIDPEACRAWAKEHSIGQQIDTFERFYSDTVTGVLGV